MAGYILTGFVAFFLLQLTLDGWLDWLNLRHVISHRSCLPPRLAGRLAHRQRRYKRAAIGQGDEVWPRQFDHTVPPAGRIGAGCTATGPFMAVIFHMRQRDQAA